jgi:hypothetical protein
VRWLSICASAAVRGWSVCGGFPPASSARVGEADGALAMGNASGSRRIDDDSDAGLPPPGGELGIDGMSTTTTAEAHARAGLRRRNGCALQVACGMACGRGDAAQQPLRHPQRIPSVRQRNRDARQAALCARTASLAMQRAALRADHTSGGLGGAPRTAERLCGASVPPLTSVGRVQSL